MRLGLAQLADLSHAIADVEAELFQFGVVKVVNVVHLLHANQTCVTLPDLFDYARASKGKVEHFFGLARVVIQRSELISQYVVAHDVNRTLHTDRLNVRINFFKIKIKGSPHETDIRWVILWLELLAAGSHCLI